MIKYSIIVATTHDFVIGKNNDLPWHSKKDLKYFKEMTTGNVVIMGRKTYESIGKPLPNRINIVISKSDIKYDGCIVLNSLESALEEANKYGKEIFIIGGSSIYKQAFPNADTLYITWVHPNEGIIKGDTKLDGYYLSEWDTVKTSEIIFDDTVSLLFETYHRAIN